MIPSPQRMYCYYRRFRDECRAEGRYDLAQMHQDSMDCHRRLLCWTIATFGPYLTRTTG
jgi:hypothetical protein